MDAEALLQCPYDKSHMIRPSRFPYHLVKCRENNRAKAKELATCPFNARHRMPKQELDLHMKNCESKCPLVQIPDDAVMQRAEPVSTWKSPPCEENWEDEEPSSSKPFVLNEFVSPPHNMIHKVMCSPTSPTNVWKPAVRSSPESLSNAGGSRAVQYQEPVKPSEEEWPRLGSHGKANRRRK
ncbi:protein D7-like isoform 1-T5 [Anomaloglossus baeobatrachus]|uniref:protein D7-like n=1 Tax=Anomaloglossus baeobatrachus TaxID=238106 RepID=UPI003F4F942F